jgi:3-keto-5-aminohexanoate cleavage enzyme
MPTPKTRRIIISVAPVGRGVPPPAVNPLTPRQVAEEAIRCSRAGAAMVHLHVRDRRGVQSAEIEGYAETLDRIRRRSDIVIQGSTGGLGPLTLEQRSVALQDPRTEVASLNMGSLNFGEEVYLNRMRDIRYWAARMRATRTVPELEIFDSGMLPAARALIGEGALAAPYAFCFCLGARWGLAADPRSLFFMRAMLDDRAPWGVIHDAMRDFSLLACGIALGASFVRVGFEDSAFYAPGGCARGNAELVARVAALVQALGMAVASPAEARDILGVAPP